jgi:GNAT superfamily N-acetyltransferase
VEIRHFDADVAEGAAELFRLAQPGLLTTAEYLIHRERTLPDRARRLALVAVDGGSVVGWGSAMLRWPGGSRDEAAVWVMVRQAHRRCRLGTELFDRAERHAIDCGATTLRTFAENETAGAAFLAARRYEERGGGIVSALDPSPVDVPARGGVEVATLSELAGNEEALFEFWGPAGAFSSASPWGLPSFEEWRRSTLANPLLEPDASFTVLADGRPVAIAWLLVDRERRRAENEWTATLPELRGRGLARLAKLHTIRWAAENGIREILTESDEGNIAMLELNRSLGYRMLWRRRYFRRIV